MLCSLVYQLILKFQWITLKKEAYLCQGKIPEDFVMVAELGTQKALADYAYKHAAKAGHPSLNLAGNKWNIYLIVTV